jgi:hypothetical protein
MRWVVDTTPIAEWLTSLAAAERALVATAIERLEEHGPALGRPTCDHVKGSDVKNLKELRPQTSTLRILFAFSGDRTAVLLVGGDKHGSWKAWYPHAIADAEQIFASYALT